MELREKIFSKLVERMATVFVKPVSELTEDVSFDADLKAKSAQLTQLTTYLENEFDIEIPFMIFRRKTTIGQAVDYVLELCEA